MSELDDAFEKIIMHKAEKMKTGLRAGSKYNKHIKIVLEQPNSTVCEEQVQNFVIGAVDAMIYDVGQALGFTKRRINIVDDWTSRRKRREMLKKIFPERTGKKLAAGHSPL